MPPEPNLPLLNAAQRRVAAFALTLFAFLAAAALLIGAVATLGWLVNFFSSVLWPLAAAGVLALILRPLIEVLESRLRLRRLMAVVLLYGVVLLVAAGALVLALPPLANQLIDFVGYLPTLWENTQQSLSARFPQWIALTQREFGGPASRQIAETLTTEGKAILSQAVPSLQIGRASCRERV